MIEICRRCCRAGFLLQRCKVTLNMEESGTSVNLYQSARRHIQDDRGLRSRRRESFKSRLCAEGNERICVKCVGKSATLYSMVPLLLRTFENQFDVTDLELVRSRLEDTWQGIIHIQVPGCTTCPVLSCCCYCCCFCFCCCCSCMAFMFPLSPGWWTRALHHHTGWRKWQAVTLYPCASVLPVIPWPWMFLPSTYFWSYFLEPFIFLSCL